MGNELEGPEESVGVAQVYKTNGRVTSYGRRVWKPAIQQVLETCATGRRGKNIGQSTGPGARSIMLHETPQNPLPAPPHIDLLQAEKRVTHSLRVHLAIFALYNGLVFAVFAVLWAVEYKMPNANDIDDIVVPWIWLICFFVASLCALGRPFVRSIWISIASALAFSGVLLLFCQGVLAPLFDPWF